MAPSLNRQDTRPESPRPMAGQTPVPISSVPSLNRHGTRPEIATAESSHKRSRLGEVNFDDNEFDVDDSDAALLDAAEAEAARPEAILQKLVPENARTEPELSTGIAAALARLRDKG